ncbi:uncharacterized protein LOC111246475 isoform X1 [Varroa destructor]|uniref:Uncharacterized protein n=1 Tax=Varroa destructor TaxID=109461 RepID=A0A7M7M5Z1_VARDE|nr:uncharacterized protein LOC111246475 isoform X1 [Varroa destructor]
MGDSDYGAAMPEALEKPPPPPEMQALASPADNNKQDNIDIETNKANGGGEQCTNTNTRSNNTAETNNNVNNDDSPEKSVKSNGDVVQSGESRPSHDDSIDRQSDLDLRLNESSESLVELDEVCLDAAAASTKSISKKLPAELQSSDGSLDTAVTPGFSSEHPINPRHSIGPEPKEQEASADESPRVEASVTDNELGTGTPGVVDSHQSQIEQPVSPAKVSGSNDSVESSSSSVNVTTPPSSAGNLPQVRSTSPEIGEGEAAPSEDVVTIVVMEKDDEEELSEEETGQEHLPEDNEAETSTPMENDDSGEASGSGEPAVKLVTIEDGKEDEAAAGEDLKQEPEGRTDNEATPAAATAPIDSDSSSREAEQAESSFLILGSDHSSGESGGEESSKSKENGDVDNVSAIRVSSSGDAPLTKTGNSEQDGEKTHSSPEEMNDERFAEIESLVAAFDRPEDEFNDGQPGSAQTVRVKREAIADSQPTVLQGKVQKKRGRKSKEEKERLARLAENLSSEDASDDSKNKRFKSEKWASGLRVKSEKLSESKHRKSAMAAAVALDPVPSGEVKEQKIQKARRTGGAPTKKETQRLDSVAGGSSSELVVDAVAGSQKDIPTVVGNGKLRVHGYDRVNPQTGLPELVTVNREALEKVISEQNGQMQRMKAKLKEMYKVCDDLRKVVLTKGLQEAVLTPEEAAIPVDVTIRMAKLPPKGLQTGHVLMAQGESTAAKMKTPKAVVKGSGGHGDSGVSAAASAAIASTSHALPVKVSQLGKLQQAIKGDSAMLAKVAKQVDQPAVAKVDHNQVVDKVAPVDGGNVGTTAKPVGKPDRSNDVDDNFIEQTRDLVDALPKDIVRALTNGDVLTAQQRQRFIDKITMDIMKAKGVPQPKQIQEIALQVANMYPRSLVILPEGKRKSNLRRKRGETDDGSEHTVAKKPRFSQSGALSSTQSSPVGGIHQVANAGKTPVKAAATSMSADDTPAPKRRGRPPKNPQGTPGAAAASPSSTVSGSPAVASKSPAPVSKLVSACKSSITSPKYPVTACKSPVISSKGLTVASKSPAIATKSTVSVQGAPMAALVNAAVASKGLIVASKSPASVSNISITVKPSITIATTKTLVIASKSPAISKVSPDIAPELLPKAHNIITQASVSPKATKSSPVKETAKTYKSSPVRDNTQAPKASIAPGSPRKGIPETSTTSQPSPSMPQASSPRKVNGGATSPAIVAGLTPVAKKRGRPKKEATIPTATVASAEELSMTPDAQKAWLREDLQRPAEEQDRAKQERLLHNCYDLLYREMAEKNYDVKYITAQWPALREPLHVLSIFKRLKKVHGEFQKQMRRDAPKLVTFLHERVTSEEGAEWSLAISQAKPGPRYHLPEEVGVMPLLALNFDEDFGLLFKLVPNEAALQKLLPELAVSQPMIIGVGSSIFSCEYRVIVERQQFFTPPPTTFLDALEWVYAAYFVFNFAYPRELSNTLEYVQRYYVGYNPHIKMVTLANSRPKIANFLKKMKDFERLDWNANNIRANSPGVPSDFERESNSEDDQEVDEGAKPEAMNVNGESAHKINNDENMDDAAGDGHNLHSRLQTDEVEQLIQAAPQDQAEHLVNPSTSSRPVFAADSATATNYSSSSSIPQTSPNDGSGFTKS